jgi:hypothetical protein
MWSNSGIVLLASFDRNGSTETVWLPLFASKVTVCVPGARDWVAVSALWLAKLLNGFPVDIHFYLTRRGAFRLKYSGHIYVAGEFNSFSWRAYLPAWLEMRAVCKLHHGGRIGAQREPIPRK